MATTRKPSAAQIAARKKFAAMAKAGVFRKNPAKRKALSRPSQATGAPASKRLVKRRKATAKAPPGFYANPINDRQLIGIKLNAGNDRNGNPRRGWIVVEILDGVDARPVGFVDEEYGGSKSLTRAYGDIPSIGVFDVSARDYADMKRQGPEWLRIGRYLGS